jgi:glutamate-1-semialdehyde 2,1-aminomutase
MGVVLDKKKTPYQINRLGSMISVHFCKEKVIDFKSATAGNNDKFKIFFHNMLKQGVYLPPSAFESWFLSNALTYADLDKTIEACEKSASNI